MPTPFDDLYDAIETMLTAVSAASPTDLSAAVSNYGTDFRITPGEGVWQIQSSALRDYSKGTVKYPRASVAVRLHHYAVDLADEKLFINGTLSHAADSLLDRATWIAQSGIYGLEPDSEPEIGDGERIGNVLSFTITAVVLMNPA